MRIAVSGTIGVGKSTLCEHLTSHTGYRLFSEPVKDNPYLTDFYEDPARWAFTAQVFLITHRFRKQMESVHTAVEQGFILDRCFHEDRVFAQVSRDLGFIAGRDWDTYLHLYESFCRIVPVPEVVIYLRIDPKEALERVALRGRVSEQSIDLDYLQRLHDSYEQWAEDMSARTQVLVFDWVAFGGARGWLDVAEALAKQDSPINVETVRTEGARCP